MAESAHVNQALLIVFFFRTKLAHLFRDAGSEWAALTMPGSRRARGLLSGRLHERSKSPIPVTRFH